MDTGELQIEVEAIGTKKLKIEVEAINTGKLKTEVEAIDAEQKNLCLEQWN